MQMSDTITQVNEGTQIVKNEKCDCIISFGGGSPHDAAKGIAVLATNGGTLCFLPIPLHSHQHCVLNQHPLLYA